MMSVICGLLTAFTEVVIDVVVKLPVSSTSYLAITQPILRLPKREMLHAGTRGDVTTGSHHDVDDN